MQSENRVRQAEEGLERPMPFSPRLGCMISVAAAVLALCLGLAFFQVAFRGGLTLHTSELRETRLWLVDNGETRGLGYSRMQRVSGSEQSGAVCLRTKVTFWLWSGGQPGLNTSYCECFQESGPGWIPAGACPD